MGREEIRAIILKAINDPELKMFYFEDLTKLIKDSTNEHDLPPEYADIIYDIIRELISQRKISPVPHGANASFYTNK